MKHSIAIKIFSLSFGILILMILVALMNSFQVFRLSDEINNISTKAVPLSYNSAKLNESGLRRRIAFERLYREYQLPKQDSSVIAESELNYVKFTSSAHDYIKKIRVTLVNPSDNKVDLELYVQGRELVSEIESTFNQQTEVGSRILKRMKNRDEVDNSELQEINVLFQSQLQVKRAELQDLSIKMTDSAVGRAKDAKNRVLLSSLIITILALIFGLWGAWILSKRLANPILSLLKSTQAVQKGNLSIIIKGLPDDEIGQLGSSMNAMISELRKKQEMQAVMSTYIDPMVVEKIILPGRAEVLAGQKQVMTILFSDIVGFTGIAERLTPSALVKMVNRYFTIMTDCIKAEGGIIDKFIGDAIMAYWGPPFILEKDQASAACRAAIRQRDALAQFREELPDLLGLRKDIPEINIRIGLATGEVVVGNIGSDTARSYTVMGDIVNLASRLESVNKQYGTSIIISDSTQRMADLQIEALEIDRIIVKGKTEPIVIYELLSINGELDDDSQKRRTLFTKALSLYRNQDWILSKAIFTELIEKHNDKTAKIFIDRINHLSPKSFGSEWDGVWRMSTK